MGSLTGLETRQGLDCILCISIALFVLYWLNAPLKRLIFKIVFHEILFVADFQSKHVCVMTALDICCFYIVLCEAN